MKEYRQQQINEKLASDRRRIEDMEKQKRHYQELVRRENDLTREQSENIEDAMNKINLNNRYSDTMLKRMGVAVSVIPLVQAAIEAAAKSRNDPDDSDDL